MRLTAFTATNLTNILIDLTILFMQNVNIPLLKKISETPGISGFEYQIRELVKEEIKDFCDEMYTDAMGNLVVLKRGLDASKNILVAAHLDEIGFIVSYIDDKGFIKFQPVGGFDPKTLSSQRVILHGKKDITGVMGSKPIHIMSAEEKNVAPKLSDYFIDTGLPKEELIKYIEIGTPVSRQRELIEMGDCVCSKSLDNRVSVYILIETLKKLSSIPYNFYAVFTVQEEVGLRGAQVAAHNINPDFALGLDVTIAYDVPGAKPEEVCTKLGEGTAIKLMDSSAIADIRMVKYLKSIAQQNQIVWQPEILAAGGTDTGPLQRNGKSGAIAGAISIPARHIHQVVEICHKKDIMGSILLLKASIENLNQFNYNWTN